VRRSICPFRSSEKYKRKCRVVFHCAVVAVTVVDSDAVVEAEAGCTNGRTVNEDSNMTADRAATVAVFFLLLD